MHISTQPSYQLGTGYLKAIPDELRRQLLSEWLSHAKETITEVGLFVPEDARLDLIVQAAMEARALYFAAALHDPTTEDLDIYFDDFVVRAVTPTVSNDPEGRL